MERALKARDHKSLIELQRAVVSWQEQMFPKCQEWELALGVCEEAGELCQCLLKMHRGINPDKFNDAQMRDSIGDVVIYLMGLCAARGWQLDEVIGETVDVVLGRNWQK